MIEDELLTVRLRLRPFAKDLSDLPALHEIQADSEHMRYYPHPFSEDETRAWIERWLTHEEEHGFSLWAIEDRETGEFLGNCGPVIQVVDGEQHVELGWSVTPRRARQGIASEAASAWRDQCFGPLGLNYLISLVRPENVPSRGVAERIGMTPWRETIFGSMGWRHIVYRLNRQSTEEQIQAATVGAPRVHDGPIELIDYDPAWPALFRREAQEIADALSMGALRIEHVGSTSVPGLAAKPIVDILLVVADSADESAYVPGMERLGYVLRIREPAWYEHRMFRGRDGDVQVHVFSEGCPEIERMVLFRDRLRTARSDRELYERTKRELASRTWRYVQNYADAKSTIVEQILTRARTEDGG